MDSWWSPQSRPKRALRRGRYARAALAARSAGSRAHDSGALQWCGGVGRGAGVAGADAGGVGEFRVGVGGPFVGGGPTGGDKIARQSEMKFPGNPRLVNAAGDRVEPYKGPVAILVDGMTGSASECFSGGLQSLGRARVFGQTSMGQALPALFDRLPNGDVLIHASGDFVPGTGVRLEARGVVPH